MKQWRKDWPESYQRMLHKLKEKWPEGRGVQEFVRILQLHQEYPAPLLEPDAAQDRRMGFVVGGGIAATVVVLVIFTLASFLTNKGFAEPRPHRVRGGT